MAEGRERFTRRVFARRVGGAVLGAPYLSLIDGITLPRPQVAQSPPLEQHVVPGVRISTDNGVEIVVPPLYHELVTARLTIAAGERCSPRATSSGSLSTTSRRDTSSGRAAWS